jgi:hypothetical protein
MNSFDREFDNERDPVMAGADIGLGRDLSTVCVRQGGVVQGLYSQNYSDTTDTTDWCANAMEMHDIAVMFIDIIGPGQGTYDQMRKMGYVVRKADSRKTPDKPDRFVNKRAEAYWTLRDAFEHGSISLPQPKSWSDPDDPIVRMVRELGAIEAKTVGGKIQILEKKEIRKTLGFSPDYADALMMTFWAPDHLFRKVNKGKSAATLDFKKVVMR